MQLRRYSQLFGSRDKKIGLPRGTGGPFPYDCEYVLRRHCPCRVSRRLHLALNLHSYARPHPFHRFEHEAIVQIVVEAVDSSKPPPDKRDDDKKKKKKKREEGEKEVDAALYLTTAAKKAYAAAVRSYAARSTR